MKKKKLVLANGAVFSGTGFGADTDTVGEIVFNTSMVGYQEIISDPAYTGQIVVMTYPLIGQYGITDEDFESKNAGIAGLVAKDYCDTPSNFRYTKTLSEQLEERNIPGLSGPDTRMLTKIIRDCGCMTAAIVDESVSTEDALKMIAETRADDRPVQSVSCTKRRFSRTPQHSFDVVVVDCGLKHSVIKELNRRGCNVTVVPFNMSAEDILAFNPDGVMICGGPGDPAKLPEIAEVVRALRGKLPIGGISLGHNVIAIAYGASTFKLKAGHHGGRPVRETASGKIITCEHNHNYAVLEESIKGTGLEITYTDMTDGTIEGLCNKADKVTTLQFYPEGAPGPKESHFFEDFIKAMED